MKKNFVSIATLFAVTLFTSIGFAQDNGRRSNQKTTGENGLPSLITFSENTTEKNSDFQKLFKENLGLKQNQNFSKIKTEIDSEGFSHEKFQLFHQGIKVEYATYTIHSKNGKVSAMSGEFYNIGVVKTTASVSKSAALNIALNHIGASKYLWQDAVEANRINYQKPEGELVLLPSMAEQGLERKSDKVQLAYKFDIYASNPISRGDLYVDANTGEVLYYNATIKHLGEHAHGAKNTKQAFTKNIEKPISFELFKNTSLVVAANAATRYSGTQQIQTLLSGSSYVLNDNTRGGGVVTYNSARTATYPSTNFTDANNDWTAAEFNNTNKDNAALDAHWGAEKTYDYFSTKHARNSYNNAGAQIKSYVHYNLIAAGYPDNNNAFWDGSRMTYGDGGAGVFDALTSIDVAAHEIGHAVCSNTANLAYQKESGAMNEGFSDIWGACVEYFAAPTKQTWLIGEDIERRTGGVSLRSMSNPNAEGQPDTYGGTYWINPSCTPTGNNDYCGVHTNSGVLNHWFYILSIGKSGTNDKGSVFNVTGITIDKAAKIAYRLESVYLSANSTFANARTSGIQSAIDLYGAGSAEVIATTNAFFAVGVGAAYVAPSTDTTVPSTPASLAASGTTASSTNLSWSASTDNVAVTGYNVYQGTTLKATVTTTSYAATGLTAATAYTFSVKAKDAAGNLSASSNVVNVTTLSGTSVAYCASKGNSVADEFIDLVSLRNVNNVTGTNAGYGNFTNLVANLPYGSNTITYSAGFTGAAYTEFWSVWIDYNKNGTFETTEKVVATSSSSSANLASTFTVPTSAVAGNTRMRVQMKYNATSTACEAFSYGEVEDYTVNIGGPAFNAIVNTGVESDNEENVFEFKMYPNPVGNTLNIDMFDNREVTFKIYNTMGQTINQGDLKQSEINVSNLNSGLYIFEINDGQKTIIKKFVKK